MSYLSQKKKHERRFAFLNTAIFFMALLTVINISAPENGFFAFFVDWQFQGYLLILFLFVYAVAVRYFVHAAVIVLFIGINYVGLSAYSNIFFNISGSGGEDFGIIYQNQTGADISRLVGEAASAGADVVALNPSTRLENVINDNYRLFHDDADLSRGVILSNRPVVRSGIVRFNEKLGASYAVVLPENGRELMIVNIDFSSMKREDEKIVFKNLEEFVLEQDIPMILVGDFGISSWKKTFRDFLGRTGLSIKNHFILSNGQSSFNPFVRPTYNLLGYKALGIKDIVFLSRTSGNNRPLLFKLGL